MVSNSANIDKTNNHLSPQIVEHKMTVTYVHGNPGLDWDRHRNMAGL